MFRYVVVPPVALGWWIRRNRDSLTDEMSMRRFGFLYRGYRLDSYPWWGCVSLLGKVAVTAIVVFVNNELEQMVTALMVFSLLLFLQANARPFKTAVLNNLQSLAYFSLFITQFVPIYISVTKTANQQDREQQLNGSDAMFVSVCLIAMNGAVIVCYLVCALREVGYLVCGYCSCCCRQEDRANLSGLGSLHEDLLGDMSMSSRGLRQVGKGGRINN